MKSWNIFNPTHLHIKQLPICNVSCYIPALTSINIVSVFYVLADKKVSKPPVLQPMNKYGLQSLLKVSDTKRIHLKCSEVLRKETFSGIDHHRSLLRQQRELFWQDASPQAAALLQRQHTSSPSDHLFSSCTTYSNTNLIPNPKMLHLLTTLKSQVT